MSGIYESQVGGLLENRMLCDMDDTLDGGGAWTVILRSGPNLHVTGTNRTWDKFNENEYKHGFGRIYSNGDYWMGLESLFILTNTHNKPFQLKVDVVDDTY